MWNLHLSTGKYFWAVRAEPWIGGSERRQGLHPWDTGHPWMWSWAPWGAGVTLLYQESWARQSRDVPCFKVHYHVMNS